MSQQQQLDPLTAASTESAIANQKLDRAFRIDTRLQKILRWSIGLTLLAAFLAFLPFTFDNPFGDPRKVTGAILVVQLVTLVCLLAVRKMISAKLP